MTDFDLDFSVKDVDVLIVNAIRLEDEENITDAMSLLKIGISLGDLTCMTRLADILSDPPGFVNVPLSIELYRKACVAGHAPACRNPAILYQHLGKSALHDRYMNLAKARGDVWQIEE